MSKQESIVFTIVHALGIATGILLIFSESYADNFFGVIAIALCFFNEINILSLFHKSKSKENEQ